MRSPLQNATADTRHQPARRRRIPAALACLGLAAALTAGLTPSAATATTPTTAPGGIQIGASNWVVPGPGLPADVSLQSANNNLDVTEAGGRRFLAFRTAPFHFASSLATMYIVSSTDGGATWTRELTVARGRDIREPRLLSWAGHTFFYFFEAGTDPLAFTPGRIFASERRSDGTWTEPIAISGDDNVVWRTKVRNGVPYMVRYHGGAAIYDNSGGTIDVELLTTTNGFDWFPVDPTHPTVYRGGGSETDFEFAPDGSLDAVIRLEEGDATGFGAKVCHAPAGDLANWTCRTDPRKYDSPWTFTQDGETYLVARRQVANNGNYDLGWDLLPRQWRFWLYEIAYSLTPKRTALWHVRRDLNGGPGTVEWVGDLPSQGDTAFAAGVRLNDRQWVVYNYTSPPNAGDPGWLGGQLSPTIIVANTVTFPPVPA